MRLLPFETIFSKMYSMLMYYLLSINTFFLTTCCYNKGSYCFRISFSLNAFEQYKEEWMKGIILINDMSLKIHKHFRIKYQSIISNHLIKFPFLYFFSGNHLVWVFESSYFNVVIVLLIYNLGLLREVKINQITDYVIYLPIPKNFLILIHGPCG